MKTIIMNKEETTIINKSKFICVLYKINNISDIDIYLDDIKNKYKGATHYCYAYILDSNKKCSDDKEPSGTAGLPILNVLEKNEMNNVICIVVRYFGGIKLGAGGLVRAYTNSVTNALENNITDIKKGLKLELTFNYDKVKLVDNLVKDNIIEESFNEGIKYIVLITYDDYNNIKDKLTDIDINILEENIVI